MSWYPTFKLYQLDGVTLQYTFTIIVDANYPNSEEHYIEHEGVRSKGSLLISGGTKAWNLTIKGYISGDNYQGLIDSIDALETAVAFNTPYVLKIDKDNLSVYSYNVKRVSPILYPIDENMRTNYQEYQITFRVNSF